MSINLTHLRAFYQVALHRGFSRAATHLNVSQPTLSSQVSSLEERHGVHLFDRRGRAIELTSSGQELFGICQRIFGGIIEAEDLLAGYSDTLTGQLRISSDSPIHAVRLVAAFKRNRPGPDVLLTIANHASVRADLEQSRADMVILAERFTGANYGWLRLARFPLVALISNRHPWSQLPEITLKELAGQKMLMREDGSMTRKALEDAAAERDLRFTDTLMLGSREAIREGVAENLGFGVIASHEFGGDTRMSAVKIAAPRITMDEYLIWPKDRARTRVGKAMIGVARSMMENREGQSI